MRLSLGVLAVSVGFIPMASAQQSAAAPSGTAAPATATPPPAQGSAPAADAAIPFLQESMLKIKNNDLDGALQKVNQAIQANPKSINSYIFRGAIYSQKKQWPQAEADFTTAYKLDEKNSVVKFNLAEVRFVQKRFTDARPGFVELQKESDLADLVSYKIFLCDLLGGHEADAKRELDVFNNVGSNPSYYYSNAAWALVHKNYDDAKSWLISANKIYSPQKNNVYLRSLNEMGLLPIPAGK